MYQSISEAFADAQEVIKRAQTIMQECMEYGYSHEDHPYNKVGGRWSTFWWWLEDQLQELKTRRAALEGEDMVKLANHLRTKHDMYLPEGDYADIVESLDQSLTDYKKLRDFYYQAIIQEKNNRKGEYYSESREDAS